MEIKNVILPMAEVGCMMDRRCCGFGNDCPATFLYYRETNHYVFDHCVC